MSCVAGVHCDHTMDLSADLSLRLDSPMFWAPWHQSMSTTPSRLFPVPPVREVGLWMCKVGVISEEQLKIEVKLLLSANRKLYMPRRLAQQRMIDLEWPWMMAVSHIARYLYGSWASCYHTVILFCYHGFYLYLEIRLLSLYSFLPAAYGHAMATPICSALGIDSVDTSEGIFSKLYDMTCIGR